jgi:hypothetical protein
MDWWRSGNGQGWTCSSLERIIVPPAIKTIEDNAFADCLNLTNVELCEEIEEIVSCDAMRDW